MSPGRLASSCRPTLAAMCSPSAPWMTWSENCAGYAYPRFAASRCWASTKLEMSAIPLRTIAASEWRRPLGIASRSAIKPSMVRSRGCAIGSSAGAGSRRVKALRNGSRRRWPTSHAGSAIDPTATLSAFAAPWSARS